MNESSRATRARLLDATRRCVRRSGVAATTSRAITTEAGANLAAITYHFGSKDDLVAEALLDAIRAGVEPALDVLRRDDLDAGVRLLMAVDALRTAFSTMAADAPAYVEALAQARHLPALREGVLGLFDELRRFVAGQMAEQKAAGQLPGWVDPEAMAGLLLATANGIVLQAVVDPDATDVNALAGQFAGLLLAARAGASPRG